MTHSHLRLMLVLAVTGILFTACGDDDPVVGNSACLDDDTACFSKQLRADDVTYSSSYYSDSVLDETNHKLSWDTGNATLAGFGPGRRMIITVFFTPHVVVLRDHGLQAFVLTAGGTTGGFNGSVSVTPDMDIVGEWNPSSRRVDIRRDSASGSVRLIIQVTFDALAEGTVLERMTFDFQVPETYTSGSAAGSPVLAGDLDVTDIGLGGKTPGNTEGDPLVWQGDSGPPATVTGP